MVRYDITTSKKDNRVLHLLTGYLSYTTYTTASLLNYYRNPCNIHIIHISYNLWYNTTEQYIEADKTNIPY